MQNSKSLHEKNFLNWSPTIINHYNSTLVMSLYDSSIQKLLLEKTNDFLTINFFPQKM